MVVAVAAVVVVHLVGVVDVASIMTPGKYNDGTTIEFIGVNTSL